MNSARTTLRVGTVPFLVARPLDCGLADEAGIELMPLVPARLVERLRAGEIDVALVSSIELFRQPGYRYLDGLAVAGHDFVSSVQVFLREPLQEVQTIAMDPASRAAATLVRVMLESRPEFAGSRPNYLECEPGEDPRNLPADAWLRIGDRALREYLDPDAHPVFNPSRAWHESTGLPFVFAAWIVRPGIEIEPWLPAFVRSREFGRERARALAAEASREWQLPLAACERYLLEECLYEPGPPMQEALFEFRRRAAALDLCDGNLAPSTIPLTTSHAS